jgi:mono/diheme cytochrome c family protein
VIPVRVLAGVAAIVLLGAAACASLAWRDAHSADEVAPSASFDASLIARGAQLAAIGNCAYCHTAPGGKPYAGGLGLSSQFGTVYSTNIGPDPDTGIGRWSLADFTQALREASVSAGGSCIRRFHNHSLWLRTRTSMRSTPSAHARPVRAEAPRNRLMFPLNLRLSAAASEDAVFGAVFVPIGQNEDGTRASTRSGLGHCSACTRRATS